MESKKEENFETCLEIIGGSGDLTSIYISGIGFYGRLDATGTKGIVIDGQNGVIISKCRFGENRFGIHFWNRLVRYRTGSSENFFD